MHNRQSGAAHVPIMFFLLLLILFLAAVSFAWMNQTKNNELTQQIQSMKAELVDLNGKKVLYDHYIEDLGLVLGKPGKYAGRPGLGIYNDNVLDSATQVGVVNPDEIAKVYEAAFKAAANPHDPTDGGISAAKGLENVLGAFLMRIKQYQDRIQASETERDVARAGMQEARAALQAKTKDVADKATWFQGEISRVEAQYAT